MAELIKDPDLLALFHFDDNLTDATGLTTMTSLQGSTAYTNGKFDKGLTMSGDGSTGWNVSNINLGTSNFTLEFWFYGTEQPTKYAKFFESSQYDTAGGIMAEVNPNTTTCYVRQCGSDYSSHQVSFSYGLNEWTHLAVVRSSGTITVYKNGVSVGSFSATNNLTATDMKIGASADTSSNVSVPCVMDELRISNTARWTSNFTPSSEPSSTTNSYVWDVYTTKATTVPQKTTSNYSEYLSFNYGVTRIYFGKGFTHNPNTNKFTLTDYTGYTEETASNVSSTTHAVDVYYTVQKNNQASSRGSSITNERAMHWYQMRSDTGQDEYGVIRTSFVGNTDYRYDGVAATVKDAPNGAVASSSISDYPQDAISGSYWYTFRGAPSGISYPDTVGSGESITITWTAGTNPLYYRVERSTDGGSTWTVLSAVVTATTYTDTDIATSTATQVMYRVCTLGEMAVSDYSTGGVVTIPRCGVRVKVGGVFWIKGTATYPKESGAWVAIPMTDEAAVFGADTHRKVVLLTS